MLGSMDELSAHPPASFLYVSGSGVYSVRVRAVPSGDGAGNRMGSCRARERVTIHGALRKRRAQRYKPRGAFVSCTQLTVGPSKGYPTVVCIPSQIRNQHVLVAGLWTVW